VLRALKISSVKELNRRLLHYYYFLDETPTCVRVS
jgi:hypothetical protein